LAKQLGAYPKVGAVFLCSVANVAARFIAIADCAGPMQSGSFSQSIAMMACR
jgi:hypothetical protein